MFDWAILLFDFDWAILSISFDWAILLFDWGDDPLLSRRLT